MAAARQGGEAGARDCHRGRAHLVHDQQDRLARRCEPVARSRRAQMLLLSGPGK